MARYTPEFLAALKHRYEKTDQPMRALALEFEIGISTLSALVERQGWAKRSQRARDRAPTGHLLAQAEELVASLPRRTSDFMDAPVAPAPDPIPPPIDRADGGQWSASPAGRLEALVLKEIEAEEAARAELDALPRLRGDAERCARTLSILTQTLQTLQRIREAQCAEAGRSQCFEYDDIPEDMDAFRFELARRIDAFVASRTGEQSDDASAAEPDASTDRGAGSDALP